MIQALMQMPRPVRLVALLIPFVVAGVLSYFFLISPKLDEIDRLKVEVGRMQRDFDVWLKAEQSSMPVREDEKKEWEKTESKFNTVFPPTHMTSRLVERLSEQALALNIVDVFFNVGDPVNIEDMERYIRTGKMHDESRGRWREKADRGRTFSYLPVKMVMRGGYKDLASYLEGLYGMNRFIEVGELRIARDAPNIQATLGLRAYYLEH